MIIIHEIEKGELNLEKILSILDTRNKKIIAGAVSLQKRAGKPTVSTVGWKRAVKKIIIETILYYFFNYSDN